MYKYLDSTLGCSWTIDLIIDCCGLNENGICHPSLLSVNVIFTRTSFDKLVSGNIIHYLIFQLFWFILFFRTKKLAAAFLLNMLRLKDLLYRFVENPVYLNCTLLYILFVRVNLKFVVRYKSTTIRLLKTK